MSTETPASIPPNPNPNIAAAYRVFRSITTRWMDNDAYGHVNNVVYYSWFDTAVNRLPDRAAARSTSTRARPSAW
jgi:acyl-CoA thioester hydrolase